MPTKFPCSFLRNRRHMHTMSAPTSFPGGAYRHVEDSPSGLSQKLAIGFWRTCIALSLLPPAYFVYAVQQRFWSRSTRKSESFSPFDAQLFGAIASPGQKSVLVRVVTSDKGTLKSKSSIRGDLVDQRERREQSLTVKAAIEVLQDAGLLKGLETTWDDAAKPNITKSNQQDAEVDDVDEKD